MTKREICERLVKTRDYLAAYEKLLLKDNCPFDADDLGACADTLRDLLLDLAAPDEHFASVGKKVREEEEKSSLSYDQVVECPNCHKRTQIGDLLYDKGEYYCPRCNFLFEELENEGKPGTEKEPKAEEKNEATKEKRPPIILYKDAHEKLPCPQCGQDCPEDLISGQYFCRTHGLFNTRRRK